MDSNIDQLEAQLFAREMADVEPIRKVSTVLLKQQKVNQPGVMYRREKAELHQDESDTLLSLVLLHKLKNDDWMAFKRNGIQAGVYKNLRTGKYPHEATLNINRKPARQARDELRSFLQDCQEMNLRSILIFFGNGGNGAELKSYLAQWLPKLDCIQAFHTASRIHGGNSAVYVLLRKSEQKRSENRERHAARLGAAR